MDNKSYTTIELTNKLQDNLLVLSNNNYAYVAGYLVSVLAAVAERGMDELISTVDYTNQRVEAMQYNERADARRQEWVDKEFA
jgi:hypothetical protein